ncbi:MAG: translesion error-prone DNA polymerase V autoproteolytic subunit [Succinivibrio sp.]|nr:translesion error-prone DNA polymerase V autoproteolytic subunit [Succinivibrio sp.]
MKEHPHSDLTSFGKAVPPRLHVELPLAEEAIEAGFPSPNGGYIDGGLDVNEFLVQHPENTFIYRVSGESMIEAGILPGDYVLVDNSSPVRNLDIVVASIDGEFTVKQLSLGPPRRLLPCNRDFPPLEIAEFSEVKIIGPVISVVRRYHSS